MKKRLFSICLLFIFCLTPIFLTACNVGGDGDGGDNDGGDDEQEELLDLGDYFEGVNTASSTETNPSAALIVDSFRKMSDNIADMLLSEYGKVYHTQYGFNELVVNEYDTHAYAIVQDGWKWGVDIGDNSVPILRTALDDMWLATGDYTSNIKYTDVLTYNMLCIVQGLEPLKITSTTDYQEYKDDGKFSDASLLKLAEPINHTGLFYYELDRIAEYILNEVIGEEIVARDNDKFINKIGTSERGKKTFDSNEYFDFGSSYIAGITKNYIKLIDNNNNTNLRSEDTSRTEEWNSINWNTRSMSDVTTSESMFDKSTNDYRVKINQFLDYGCASDKYRQLRYFDGENLVYQPLEEDLEEGKTPIYSGFKNYVNTVYKMVYTVVTYNNLSSFFLSPIAYIEDMHLSRVGVSDSDATESAFLTPAYQYKSLVLKAKQAVTISALTFWFELDPSITEEVTLEVKGRYQYCTTSHTHVHTKLCQFEVKEYNFGAVTIIPGTLKFEVTTGDANNMFSGDATVNEVFTNGGALDFDLTEPNEDGNVELIYLSKFQKPFTADEILPGMEIDFWQDGFVTAPTSSFLGSLFQYKNDRSEFLEFCFNVVKGPSDAKFKFALFQLEIDTEE